MSKRDREINIQGWFDPDNPAEKDVIKGYEYLKDKFGMTAKQTLGESILFAARSEGFMPQAAPAPVADNRLNEVMRMMTRLMNLIENGSFVPASEAARQAFDEDTVEFDAISASVGSRYVPMRFEEDED